MKSIKTRRAEKITGYLIIIYYTVGLVGLSLPSTRDTFIGLMPLTLVISTLVLLFFHRKWRRPDVPVLLLIAAGGFLVEVAGVLSGNIFGAYWYGETLGPVFLETPLLIGVNWMMLTYCTYSIMENTRLFWPLKAFAAAVLMLSYDLVLEPVAIRTGMWYWEGGSVPLQNYQAWFVISLVFLAVMHIAGIKTGNRVAQWLFGVQFIFFIMLNLTLRLF